VSALPAVEPMPPRASGVIPWLGAGLGLLRDPTAHLTRLRARLGDSFVLDGLGYRLFFVFGAEGVRALYAAPEHEASFGLATFELVMKRKIPLELAIGRRNRPHDLFKNPDVESYLGHLEEAVRLERAELGERGSLEAFAEAKRLGYRLGLACWAGAEAASKRFLPALISAFERLDTADSFVRPLSTAWTLATKKRGEWRAMREIEAVIHTILDERRASGRRPGDFLDQIEASFADVALPERDVEVARDLMLIQIHVLGDQPDRGARPRPLRPRPLRRPPARRRGRPARSRAGQQLRPRPPRLPRAALLDLGDPDRRAAARRALRPRASLPRGGAPRATDRRGRTRRPPLPRRVHRPSQLTPRTRVTFPSCTRLKRWGPQVTVRPSRPPAGLVGLGGLATSERPR